MRRLLGLLGRASIYCLCLPLDGLVFVEWVIKKSTFNRLGNHQQRKERQKVKDRGKSWLSPKFPLSKKTSKVPIMYLRPSVYPPPPRRKKRLGESHRDCTTTTTTPTGSHLISWLAGLGFARRRTVVVGLNLHSPGTCHSFNHSLWK